MSDISARRIGSGRPRERVVAWREEHGGFESVDLAQSPRVERKLQTLRPHVIPRGPRGARRHPPGPTPRLHPATSAPTLIHDPDPAPAEALRAIERRCAPEKARPRRTGSPRAPLLAAASRPRTVGNAAHRAPPPCAESSSPVSSSPSRSRARSGCSASPLGYCRRLSTCGQPTGQLTPGAAQAAVAVRHLRPGTAGGSPRRSRTRGVPISVVTAVAGLGSRRP